MSTTQTTEKAEAHTAEDVRPQFCATRFNQYGRALGYGWADTEAQAIANADREAGKELATANPHWNWRKAKLRIDRPSWAKAEKGAL